MRRYLLLWMCLTALVGGALNPANGEPKEEIYRVDASFLIQDELSEISASIQREFRFAGIKGKLRLDQEALTITLGIENPDQISAARDILDKLGLSHRQIETAPDTIIATLAADTRFELQEAAINRLLVYIPGYLCGAVRHLCGPAVERIENSNEIRVRLPDGYNAKQSIGGWHFKPFEFVTFHYPDAGTNFVPGDPTTIPASSYLLRHGDTEMLVRRRAILTADHIFDAYAVPSINSTFDVVLKVRKPALWRATSLREEVIAVVSGYEVLALSIVQLPSAGDNTLILGDGFSEDKAEALVREIMGGATRGLPERVE